MKLTNRFTIIFITLFFAVGLFFSFLPKRVKADTTNVQYRFSGSNIFLPFVGTDDMNGYKKGFYLLDFQFTPLVNSSGFTNPYQVNLKAQAFYVTDTSTDTFFNLDVYYSKSYNSISKANHTLETLPSTGGNLSGLIGYLLPDSVRPDSSNFRFGGYAQMSLSSIDFVPNISKIEIGSNTTTSLEFPQTYNFVRYYDINGNFFQFSVETSKSATYGGMPFDMVLENRVYYVGDNTTNDYDNGYYNGFNDGEKQGYNEGKTVGLNLGKQQGYTQGYNEGVASANNYSFLGLMTSVIDAPLRVFSQMFDFNLLGVNMKTFYLSIFTACIVVIILKKVI